MECQCLRGKGQNTTVLKDRTGIPMFERIGQEFYIGNILKEGP